MGWWTVKQRERRGPGVGGREVGRDAGGPRAAGSRPAGCCHPFAECGGRRFRVLSSVGDQPMGNLDHTPRHDRDDRRRRGKTKVEGLGRGREESGLINLL